MQARKEVLRAPVPHRARADLCSGNCLVTLVLAAGLPPLESEGARRVLRAAIAEAEEALECRLVRFAAQGRELLLVVEAPGREALARAMKGLCVRLARGLNRLAGRSGPVFEGRYAVAELAPVEGASDPAEPASAMNGTARERRGAGRAPSTLPAEPRRGRAPARPPRTRARRRRRRAALSGGGAGP